jgi:hypothetical protein
MEKGGLSSAVAEWLACQERRAQLQLRTHQSDGLELISPLLRAKLEPATATATAVGMLCDSATSPAGGWSRCAVMLCWSEGFPEPKRKVRDGRIQASHSRRLDFGLCDAERGDQGCCSPSSLQCGGAARSSGGQSAAAGLGNKEPAALLTGGLGDSRRGDR